MRVPVLATTRVPYRVGCDGYMAVEGPRHISYFCHLGREAVCKCDGSRPFKTSEMQQFYKDQEGYIAKYCKINVPNFTS